jgi:hypothetical protein
VPLPFSFLSRYRSLRIGGSTVSGKGCQHLMPIPGNLLQNIITKSFATSED